MRWSVKCIMLLIAGFVFNTVVISKSIHLIERIEFSSKSALPISPWDFCVTDDELFIIPDYRAANIKVYQKYEKYLELVKTIGKKGYGRDGLVKPTFCFYNKEESKFGVMDIGIRKIFIYDRIGRIDFRRTKEVLCLEGATDIQLKDDRLFIAGYKVDRNPHGLALLQGRLRRVPFIGVVVQECSVQIGENGEKWRHRSHEGSFL